MIRRKMVEAVYARIIKLDTLRISIENIRTDQKDAHQAKCKADLAIHAELIPGIEQNGPPDTSRPITYEAEITDEGNLYITVDGL